MDTNHRGGPPGFVRILSNDEDDVSIVYPEYSGNRLYQTLGNFQVNPRAGLVFPDFETGDVLYVTGTTEILAGKSAADLMAHTNLVVKIKIEAARYVSNGLAFRGVQGEASPYNPPVRFLANETAKGITSTSKQVYAKLIDKKIITPTIARYRFHVPDPGMANKWKPGQYVALSFADELDIGYSHMRDDDPKSLNDDFLRTFTISSRQDALDGHDQFEITVRTVGPVTDFLFRHNIRSELEVPLQGFGGEFYIKQGEGETVAFIAGGVGITPLLAQAQDLDLHRLQLYWANKADDLSLVTDTFDRIPELASSSRIFITGKINEKSNDWKKLVASGAAIERRRMAATDMSVKSVGQWYLCTGTTFRSELLKWLDGKTVHYEDFNY